ncbi:MAG TPA: cellulase family glycosylhydrolase, partial [Spirochaetia bacterium]
MIGIDGARFVDKEGRTLMLRGANLGGNSKVPASPDGATHLRGSLDARRDVSFVGRPFALEDADEHLDRLRHWGMTFLRFLVTWEALEHEGPGRYDERYIDYVHAVAEKAAARGMTLYIDPHQDMWSRWTGGDGAPAWTLESVGFDLDALDETGAAFTHQRRGDPFPRMTWPTNSGKLGAATMFTLFYAGSTFAPRTTVEGEPVQEWLQRRYIDAMVHLARRLSDLPNIAG